MNCLHWHKVLVPSDFILLQASALLIWPVFMLLAIKVLLNSRNNVQCTSSASYYDDITYPFSDPGGPAWDEYVVGPGYLGRATLFSGGRGRSRKLRR